MSPPLKLLAPLDINGMVLPNRVVVPAMVTRLSGEDGVINDHIIDRYVRYAAGQVGLIVVEATAVHGAKSGPLLRLSDDSFIPGHRDLAQRIHDTSPSKVVPQIIHFMKVARSGWRQTIEDLDPPDIARIIEEFGLAALRVREAGYDGVELHSAHAYTLSSFLSRRNRRKDRYGGHTLEGRLALFGDVLAAVRRRVGADFPIGVRFLAEEAIKGGYALPEAQQIALRMAQLGVDYISLSVGGKFEDAEQRPGQPLYPYTGYSGDRCMPGDWYPDLPHVHLAAGIKTYLNQRGHDTPVISAGKIAQPDQAEGLLQSGQADLIGMARQLLADPDWTLKVMQGREDEITRCVYCNVCKDLDERFREVTCFLWPKGQLQAPDDQAIGSAPYWADAGAELSVSGQNGRIKLAWSAAEIETGGSDIAGYDIYRADAHGTVKCIEAVKGRRYVDRLAMAGQEYRYFVRAFDRNGRASPPSETIAITMTMPEDIMN
ncbi:MAG: NADH:flavin oxidoreductase [Rhodospirillaceae bacterium]|jgi:2,4-dienoyl-CoA reductase-like NADH-dependent reductase (Old Yellow Enzyme family)|nr:NADH:flavin oxidoreductase [Rhodospirillaceae bacterium]MBT4043242.1 NADH:flavin oxidoreductase [Rhodospirillaceae bacterium]MBT4688549.1 NADH:flavin oxidoreductase [Rhodospirillaceae bacterium]MBT5082282.1 NADH:flavin oxidoreductase [Rhodospirillaceae bacterium]MBT5526801.1 NADH:flavin oxidoreductase [Rhodospirillaceae bacterium]